ncbi:MAG: hypothetical protein J6B32_04390 [Spirochaetaceae bacterium]|nr:hypothetical protein [Spirochaetaceae bacterium]
MAKNNFKTNLSILVLVAIIAFSFFDCEVGLGTSVDTQPPVVAITSPGKGAVIRNTFTMKGTTDDETYVQEVSVLFTSNTEKGKKYGPYKGKVDKKEGTWSVVINEKRDGEFSIPDGEYGVTVTAKDSASRTSVAESLYTIDNTAPIVVIKSPSLDSSFGQTIKITGDISDTTGLGALYFTAYNKLEDGRLEKIGETQRFQNISGVGLELIVGQYYAEEPTNEREKKLYQVYKAYYGDAEETKENIYCGIEVEDLAKEYNPPEESRGGEREREVEGNISTGYYLYSEIYNDIYSDNGLGLTNQDIIKVMNGTYGSASQIQDIMGILDSYKIPTEEVSSERLSKFSLNPKNNPTYDVGGYSIKSGEEYTDVSNEGTINVSISPGPDNIDLVEDSIRIILTENDQEVAVLYESSENIANMSEAEKTAAETQRQKATVKMVDTSYTISLSIGVLVSGHTYDVVVEGRDFETNSLLPNSVNGYGFRVISNNKPPELKVSSGPENNSVINEMELTYSGKIFLYSAEGLPELKSCNITVTDSTGTIVSGYNNVSIPTEKISIDEDGNWTVNIDETCFATPLGEDLYSMTLTFTPFDSVNNETGAGVVRYVNLDTKDPDLTISTISPLVDDGIRVDNVNGRIKIQGTISDNYMLKAVDGVKYDLFLEDEQGNFGDVPVVSGTLNASAAFTLELDTTDNSFFIDLRNLKIIVTATDSAGNTCNPVEKTVYINQATDKPTVSYSNLIEDNNSAQNLLGMGSWTIYGTAKDDDGLKSVKIKLDDQEPIELYTEAQLNGTTSQSISYTIPEEKRTSGSHTVCFVLTDINGLEETTSEVTFNIDDDAPVIAITSPSSEFASQSVTVVGTASDANGIASVELVSVKKNNAELTLNPAPSVTTSDNYGNWSCNVALLDSQVDESAIYTQTYRVTDIYNRQAETSVSYKVDKNSPKLQTVYVSQGSTKVSYPLAQGSKPWFTQSALTLSGSITEANLSSITMTYYLDEGDESTKKEVIVTPFNDFNVTESFGFEGSHTVSLTLKDKAENPASFLISTLNIDTEAPVLESYNLDVADSVTSSNNVTVTFTASDATSGLSKYYIGTSHGFEKALAISSGTLLVNGESSVNVDISSFAENSHTLYLRLEDVAGNSTEDVKLGSFIRDVTAPGVIYTSHNSNATVNKTITITGTVTDVNIEEGAMPILYAKDTSDNFKTIGNTVDSDVKIDGLNISPMVGGMWTISGFDTSVFDSATFDRDGSKAGIQILLMVAFTDKAGNSTTDDTLMLSADQNTDRPLVKLSNVNTAGTTILRSAEISGTVTDDDGIDGFYIQVVREGDSFNDSNWQELTIVDGNWLYSFESTGTDGSYIAYFKVVDTENTVFTIYNEDNDVLERPYIQYQSVEKVWHPITFGLDTNPPTVLELEVSTDGTSFSAVTNNMVFGGGTGGAMSKLYFRTQAEDTVTTPGNLSVSLTNLGNLTSTTMNYSEYHYYNTELLDLSNSPSGSYTITVIAKDESGMTGQFSRVVIIDNDSPDSISSVIPSKTTEVTGEVSMSGFVADESNGNSGILSMQYALPPYGTTNPATISSWKEMSSFYTTSWAINFTDLGDYVGDFALSSLKSKYSGYETSSGSGLYDLPIWFRVTDKAGNLGYITDAATIRYNPDADKPRVEITYPRHDQIVGDFGYVIMGGTVRITGSAEDNEGIDSVWLQYDLNGDGDFDWATANDTDAALYKNLFGITPLQITGLSGQYGIKATGSVSWSSSLQVSGLTGLNYSENNGATLNVRAVAIDNDSENGQLAGAWSDIIHISVNNSVPQFGSYDSLKLKRFNSNGEAIAEQEYSTDMYIKGTDWFLTGSITDDDGLKAITVTGSSNGNLNTSDWFTAHTIGNNTWYDMKIPVVRSDGGSGSWTINVVAEDDDSESPKTSVRDFSLNIDNEAPIFDGATVNTPLLYKNAYGNTGILLSSTEAVQNSNGLFTLAGRVSEDGSGFDRMVIFFKRQGDTTRVYNVMESSDNRTDLNLSMTSANATNGSIYINDDNLPVLKKTSLGRGSESSSDFLTFDGASTNKNIRPGGLVKIGGIYRLISNIDGNEIKFSPSCSTEFTEAEFVYGLVLDNTGESLNSNGTVKNDDGDDMVETYSKSGYDYTWDISVNSKNIPDGPIQVCVVAFDEAGNSRFGQVTSTVSNNRPRITSVKLGTDLSGNGSYEEKEYTTFYLLLNEDGTGNTEFGTDIWDLNTGTWTVKSGLAVKPQFVGGTEPMYYRFSKSTSGERLNVAETGSVQVFDINDGFTLTNNTIGADGEDSTNTYRFSFWDSTEETDPGVDSQWTVLNATLKQDLTDAVSSKIVIDPFYWKGSKDNSLYANSSKNGHIEFESDLPDTIFTESGTGIYDIDPKVSGRITIRGYAYDDVRLSSLWMQIPGFTPTNYVTNSGYGSSGVSSGYYQFAYYKIGTGWILPTATIESNGWEVTISEDEVDGGFLNQEGHKVVWTLSFDTSKITNVAALDVDFKVMAVDHTNSAINISPSTKQGTLGQNDYNKPTYQMDIVPYITGISTPNRTLSGLKANNIRSASGKYSVIKGTTANFISVNGFNLNPSAVRIVDSASMETATSTSGTAIAYSNIATDYTSLTLSNNVANSGYVELFTNGIRTLNNVNNNDSLGSFIATGTEGTITIDDYGEMPNREPDYFQTKNILLNDDRYLRFFDMKDTGIKNGYYPTMIMEGDDPVFGYIDLKGGPIDPERDDGIEGIIDDGGAGKYYDSHAMPQRAKINGTDGSRIYTEYLIKASIWDQMGMARDESGRFHHITLYNRDGSSMAYIYDRFAELHPSGKGWGDGVTYSGFDGSKPSHSNNNAIRLEYVDYGEGLLLGRYQYPKIIAKGNSVTGAASIYQLYFDANTTNKELIFRNFKVGNEGDYPLFSGGYATDGGTYSQVSTLGDSDYNATRITAATSASNHFSFDVSGAGRVVIVYYDESLGRLVMKVSATSIDGSNPSAAREFDTSSIVFPDYIGSYVSMCLDSSGGVHISAYDSGDSDLVYIYVKHFLETEYEMVRVDQASAVGNWTQIKLKDNVPYIAYYNATEAGGKDSIKLAYANSAVNGIETVVPGVDDEGYTTGKWEYMTVPAITVPQGGAATFQNVCLDFNSEGKPVVGYLGSNLEFGTWVSE